MPNLRQIAEKVGLLHVTCRHCRQKTKLGSVFEEFTESIMEELAKGERIIIPGFGSLFPKRKVGKIKMRKETPIITKEGVSVKFQLSPMGIKNMQKLYDSVKDIFKEKMGL